MNRLWTSFTCTSASPRLSLYLYDCYLLSLSLSLLRNSRLHPSPATLLSAPKVCDAIIAAFLVSRLLFKSSFRLLRTLRRRRGRKKKKKKGRGVVDKREEGADATVRQSQSRWDDKQYLLLVSLFAYACSLFLFLFYHRPLSPLMTCTKSEQRHTTLFHSTIPQSPLVLFVVCPSGCINWHWRQTGDDVRVPVKLLSTALEIK